MSAILAFEDGTIFKGKAFGAKKTVCGEAVFNTSVFGYEELLTDPSNYKNVLIMTFVEIGCYGINEEDGESDSIKAAGLVVAQECEVPSNWRSKMSLNDYLLKYDVPAIYGVDTRAIARYIGAKGTMKVCLSTEDISDEEAVKRAKEWEGTSGVDLVKDVSTKSAYYLDESKFDINPFKLGGVHINEKSRVAPLFKCAAIDFGASMSTLKSLAYNGFDITVFPASASAEEILKTSPDCLFLTSGAGDASALTYAHKTVAELVKTLPTLAVGLGHQVFAYAMGAKTFKMSVGHHGGNYPSKNVETDIAKITAQNHTYAVDAESVKGTELAITEVNLTDGTVEALKHKTLPAFSVQYSAGEAEFAQFYKMVASKK